jgi:hypothetical protein
MARETGRVVTRQQMIDLLAVLDITEEEMSSIRSIDIGPASVRIVRDVRGEAGGSLLSAYGQLAEHVEERPIDWRKA